MMVRRTGFRAQPTMYRLSLAPTSRAKCRACKRIVEKDAVRLEMWCFVKPGRSTTRVVHANCVTAALARNVVKVHGFAVPATKDVNVGVADGIREQIASLA